MRNKELQVLSQSFPICLAPQLSVRYQSEPQPDIVGVCLACGAFVDLNLLCDSMQQQETSVAKF